MPLSLSCCFYPLLLAPGLLLLAVEPVRWLAGTWIDPAYDSQGPLVAALVAGLLLWSLTSPRVTANTTDHRRGLCLLLLTAGVRLAGQVLGVHVIGALALVLDLYALGLLLELHRRRRPLAPAWLAVLFALALPVERILQRSIGFGLQQVAAAGACRALSLGSDPVQCEGVRILLAGQDVLVDLPCSGARGLLLLLLLFAALATLIRPRPAAALAGLIVTLIAAVVANVLRIVLLALGLAYPSVFGGIDVMAAPWHEGIGLLTLLLGALPVLLWAGIVIRTGGGNDTSGMPVPPNTQAFRPPVAYRDATGQAVAAFAFLLAAAVIVSLPARPLDVARPTAPVHLPAVLAGWPARYGALSDQEQSYFTRYGGGAARAVYGPYTLLTVSTSAPLRHLHAPDECLAGSGHRVRYLGASYRGLPTALYRSTDPDGHSWRVAVTFMSDRGELATSVTEAVWRWLQRPGATWTMVQRIAPWGLPEEILVQWDTAVAQALELPQPVIAFDSPK
jgi:exosortase/archaeosortase family protein